MKKYFKLSCIINLLLFIIKLMGGILCKSSSFIADSLHSCGLFVTDLMDIYNDDKQKDDKLYLVNVIAGLIVLFLGFGVIYNVVGKKYYLPSKELFILCSLAILIKLVLSLYLMHEGKETDNVFLSMSAYNSRLDVISSMLVLFSTMFVRIFSGVKLIRYFDMIPTLIIGLIIIYSGFNYLKEVISYKIGIKCEDEKLINDVRVSLTSNKCVKELDEVTLLQIGNYYKLVGSVEMDGEYSLFEVNKNLNKIERKIKSEFKDIKDITIKVSPYRRVL